MLVIRKQGDTHEKRTGQAAHMFSGAKHARTRVHYAAAWRSGVPLFRSDARHRLLRGKLLSVLPPPRTMHTFQRPIRKMCAWFLSWPRVAAVRRAQKLASLFFGALAISLFIFGAKHCSTTD